ncbi:SH3 domain-containing protein [Streptomyces cacaoi]|uniref:hypothetical protein n=1 Tax=Streptomyces cacaoi TaxID=1898 RepID=UPI00374A6CEC
MIKFSKGSAVRAAMVAGASVIVLGGIGVGSASAAPLPDGWRDHPDSITVAVDGLRVRGAPGNGLVHGLAYKGNEVKILATSTVDGQPWDKIRLKSSTAGGLRSGTVGWVTDAYVVRNHRF